MTARLIFALAPLVVFGGIVGCAADSPGIPSSSTTTGAPATEPPPDDTAPPVTTPPPTGPGCGASNASGVQNLSVDVAGKARAFIVSVPKGNARAWPVVFVFHGGGGTAAGVRDYFGFSSIAEDKAIFVYPTGLRGQWDLDTPAAKNADVAFFDAMLEKLVATQCVDTSRVFATGNSMGGYFANQLGCRRGDALRAIAPHAGGGPYENDDGYDDQGHLKCVGKPVATMVFHGLADTNVDPKEGQLSVDYWAYANKCARTTKDFAPSPCVAYDGCVRPVVSCRIPGLGHKIWSEGPKATWNFFASF